MDVLIVDDERLVREIVSDNLADDGFHVAKAGSTEDALCVIEALGLVKVVVIDVNLGSGTSGLHLVEEIHRRSPSTGVVIMTGDPNTVGQWK